MTPKVVPMAWMGILSVWLRYPPGLLVHSLAEVLIKVYNIKYECKMHKDVRNTTTA